MIDDGPGDRVAHFDAPDVARRNRATREVLHLFLPDLSARLDLRTALDVGAGFGYFSEYARGLGLRVQGVDVRPENVREAQRRFPDIPFHTADIEDPALAQLGTYDIVLCLGVLHHLENPLKALRNLASITGQILVLETMVTPFAREVLALSEEGEGQHQAVNYLGLIPSNAWLEKALRKVSFPFVFRPTAVPAHRSYRSSLLRHRERTLIIASKSRLVHPHLTLVPDSGPANPYLWYRRGLTLLLETWRLRGHDAASGDARRRG